LESKESQLGVSSIELRITNGSVEASLSSVFGIGDLVVVEAQITFKQAVG
jgi:hypothetical protein